MSAAMFRRPGIYFHFTTTLVVGVLGLLFVFLWSGAQAQIPDGFIREQLATGLNPTSIVVAPDGRIFITEKDGEIRIVRDGQLLDNPFLKLEVDDSNERGLGHMVLHPDFEQNNYYYVFYSVPGLRHNRVSRFTANGDNTIPGSELVLLDLDVLGTDIHNGGDMVFGFDGHLYISTGEGGENWHSNDLSSTNGKVLRIDDEGKAVTDNPWIDLNQGRSDLVYAYGFRNPFTMTINPITGEIFVNDVGGNNYEEINQVVRGGFYGWPVVEGKRTSQIVPDEYRDPVFTYGHFNNYCAVVGATFYEPQVQQFPEKYLGRYFYSDYCTGNIRTLDVPSGLDKGTFISDGDRVVDLDVTEDGSLLYLERKGLGDGSPEDNTGSDDGVLWKVTYTGSGAPFISIQPKSVLSAIGEDATFTVVATGAMPLMYEWTMNDVVLTEHNHPTLDLFNVTLDQDSTTIQVKISNGEGFQLSEEVLLRVTENHRPAPTIQMPVEGALYSGGDLLQFSGQAVDVEDGLLPAEALSWKIDFHHGTHSHPGMSWTSGVSSGEWTIPTLGETSTEVWYRFYLKATDSEGFTEVTYRDIFPRLGTVHVDSDPTDLIIHLDGSGKRAPYSIEGVQNISRFVTPPAKQVLGDKVYFFDHWENGSTVPNREVRTMEDAQHLVGTFEGLRTGRGYGLTASYYDNIYFDGEPIVVAIDSIVDHQYHLGAPYPGVPEEEFGIIWDGYLQPYRSGWYTITLFADDGIYVELNNMVIIDNWTGGVHHEEGSLYLEEGKSYPIQIKLYDGAWGSQIHLRWSSQDFPEEVIPSSQLYPADIFDGATEPEVLVIESITSNELQFSLVSYVQAEYQMSLVSVDGRVIDLPAVHIFIGKNFLTMDIRHLSAGLYYLIATNSGDGTQTTLPFVKSQ